MWNMWNIWNMWNMWNMWSGLEWNVNQLEYGYMTNLNSAPQVLLRRHPMGNVGKEPVVPSIAGKPFAITDTFPMLD